MTIPDLINGSFEALGGVLNWMNCYRLYKDKEVKGVFPLVWVFFASWGLWNLYFYPSLDQWLSFYGGLVIVSANLVWVGLCYYYLHWYNKKIIKKPQEYAERMWEEELKRREKAENANI